MALSGPVTEQMLYFCLGLLIAFLASLMLAPPVWRFAQALERKRLAQAHPQTAEDKRAARDLLRADFAVQIVALEQRLAAAQDHVARLRGQLSRKQTEFLICQAQLAARTSEYDILRAAACDRADGVE